MGASSSPFSGFLPVSVADLHAFVEETAFLAKTFDQELSLSLDSFRYEVEPAVVASGVGLRVE